eukprot:jgi/Orpsp1_1/1178476/evm.model.c7180000065464.1
MKNEELITKIRELGINELKENYTLLERPLPPKFKDLKINGMGFDINQYEIVGFGNLSLMGCNTPFFQMLTFIVTPFYKDIPMLSTDYILKGDQHQVINEVYSLVTDKNDDMFKEYIEKFKENMASCKLKDNEYKPCWYEDIRPAYADKSGPEAEDEAIINLFKGNIQLLKEFEQKRSFLEDIKQRVAKYDITKEYATNLVEKGGISTNMFKAAIGEDTTKEFYYTVLFGTECFKP